MMKEKRVTVGTGFEHRLEEKNQNQIGWEERCKPLLNALSSLEHGSSKHHP